MKSKQTGAVDVKIKSDLCEQALKRLTDLQNSRPQIQVMKGTLPRWGGGRCWSNGETGTKRRRRRRRWWGCRWSTHALSAGKRGKREIIASLWCCGVQRALGRMLTSITAVWHVCGDDSTGLMCTTVGESLRSGAVVDVRAYKQEGSCTDTPHKHTYMDWHASTRAEWAHWWASFWESTHAGD